jgi:CheY-like chemotaxis protein
MALILLRLLTMGSDANISRDDSTKGLTILIVEDEMVSRHALKSVLTDAGFRPIAVDSAESALNLLSGQPMPELALVDFDLPGMSGAELVREIQRRSERDTPFIVLMSATDPDQIDPVLAAHSVPIVRKPLHLPSLLTLLTKGQPRQ